MFFAYSHGAEDQAEWRPPPVTHLDVNSELCLELKMRRTTASVLPVRGHCKTVHLNSCKPQFWHGDYLTDPDPLALNFTLHPRTLALDIHKTHLVQSHKADFPTTSWTTPELISNNFLPSLLGVVTAVLMWWYDNDRPVTMTLRSETDQTPDTLPAFPTPSSQTRVHITTNIILYGSLCFCTIHPVLFVTTLNVSKNSKWDSKGASELKNTPI